VHVGLNLVFLTPGQQGGMEIYARELIARLSARDDLRLTAFVNRDALGTGWGEGVAEVLVPVRASDRKQWVIGEQWHLPRLAAAAGCDLVHSLASTAPVRGAFRRITTIHDLNYLKVPDTHFGLLGLGMRVLVPAAAHRSHRIIAISQSTADDVVSHLRVPRRRIDVVPQGVSPLPAVTPTPEAQLRAALELGDRPVVLSFSAKRPHKNLLRLIEAHARLAAPRPVLVLPGYPTSYEATLRDRACDLGTAEDVRFLDWVDDADREGLYALATVFAFPSLYEGFGLPPLEAMARGVPVVTSSRGSLAEVAAGAAAVVDPDSIEVIADAIARLLGDPAEQARLRVAGRARAAGFTWDRTAELTAAAYRRALAR
jgi:glycosyltransferase involved in cell wall biosynthesis